MHRGRRGGKEPSEEAKEAGKVFKVEQYPAQKHGKNGIKISKNPGGFFQELQQEQLFQNQEHRIVKAPQNEVPAGSMPEAGQAPHNQKIENLTGQSLPVASQGDIHILPEPGGKGDVPPAPEFRNAGTDVGIVEVFQKLEAKHPPQASCHIGITGKVKVNLQRVSQDSHPGGEGPPFCLEKIPQIAHGVGQQHLFPQAQDKQLDTGGKVMDILPAVLHLLRHILVPDNGTGNELREQGDIGTEGQRILLNRRIVAVHVNHIAHGLEHIKGNADGQGDFRSLHAA